MKTNRLALLFSSVIATEISFSGARSAQAFTLVFDDKSTSSNSPATGASAIADFDFFDIASNGVRKFYGDS